MASSSDPANVGYIIQENGFWYVAYKEKVKVPEVVVSAKGVVNGLSEEYNDGWDFGPDSYDPSNSASPPYSQTSGIQEGINYISAKGHGKMKLIGGVFDITNAPLIEDPNNSGVYCQVYIPYIEMNSSSSPGLMIEIDSDWGLPFYVSQAVKTPIGATYIQSNYSGSETLNVFYAMHGPSTVRGGQSSIFLGLGSLAVFSYPNSNINAIDISAVEHAKGENIAAITTNMLSYTGLPTVYGGTGINLQIPGYGGTKTFKNVFCSGYNIGLIPNVHTAILKYETYFINIGIQTQNDISSSNTEYVGYIGYYDCQMTSIAINGISGKISISVLSYGDVETTSGYFFSYKYHIQVLSGNSLYAYIDNQTVNVTSISTSNPFGTPEITPAYNIAGIFNGKINHSLPSLSPTLSTNPPATATVYQNTNPYDIRIYLPAYATTSGTAGSVAIALGSTSTPTAIGTKFVSGATSSNATDIIELVVPAGWWYSYTLTGVTLATASVFAV